MEGLYRELILEHYKYPRYKGTLSHPTVRYTDANPLCGDELTVELMVNGEERIQSCRFHGKGCAISQAAADILCEEVEGKRVEEVLAMTKEEMLELLGIPLGPVRVKCGLLAFKVTKMALMKVKEGKG